MSNPARELAGLLRTWQQTAQDRNSIHLLRETAHDETDGWLAQVHAAEQVGEIHRYLVARVASGGTDTPWAEWQAVWAKEIFAPDANWSTGHPAGKVLVTKSALDMLDGLAEVMDHTRPTPALTDAGRKSVSQSLDQILEILSTDEFDLAPAVKQYVFELINSCRTVLSEAVTLGDVDIKTRLYALFGVLSDIADSLEAEDASRSAGERLRAAARGLVKVVGYGAIAIGVGADVLQITQGLN